MRKSKQPPKRTQVKSDESPFELPIRQIKEMEERKVKQKEAQVRLKEAANIVAASAEGMILLKYILELSGHKKHKAVVDPTSGEVNTQSTVWNVARESLYLSVSKLLDERNLKRVEY